MLSGRLFDEDSAYSTNTRVFAKGNRMLPSKALRDQLIACFKDKNDYFEVGTHTSVCFMVGHDVLHAAKSLGQNNTNKCEDTVCRVVTNM